MRRLTRWHKVDVGVHASKWSYWWLKAVTQYALLYKLLQLFATRFADWQFYARCMWVSVYISLVTQKQLAFGCDGRHIALPRTRSASASF